MRMIGCCGRILHVLPGEMIREIDDSLIEMGRLAGGELFSCSSKPG
jgi:hypothetical protein